MARKEIGQKDQGDNYVDAPAQTTRKYFQVCFIFYILEKQNMSILAQDHLIN